MQNPNVHKLQPKKPMHFAETKCAELQPKKPMRSKCANFFVCTGKPRITKMHFNAETPSARCKCAQMPKEIQCRCNARCNSVQQQCKKPIIPRCCNFLPHKIHQVRTQIADDMTRRSNRVNESRTRVGSTCWNPHSL